VSRTIQPPSASTLRKYGMSAGDWRVLFAHQGGRCPACDKRFTMLRHPCVDHDHATGLVRGLLCKACNHALGVLHEDVGWLKRTAAYLERPPAVDCFDTPPRDPNGPPCS
jgi:hypothetical protein